MRSVMSQSSGTTESDEGGDVVEGSESRGIDELGGGIGRKNVDILVKKEARRRGASGGRKGSRKENCGDETVASGKRRKVSVMEGNASQEGENLKKEHQRRHTQNSRAKLNSKFNELLELIQPLYKVDPDHTPHRSEVLDYAIHAFNDLTERKIYLETEIALSSNESLSAYVRSAVLANTSLTRVLEDYLSMVCAKKQWRYAELWCPTDSRHTLRLSGATIYRTVVGEELSRVQRFRTESLRVEMTPPMDLVGRVYHTLRTEWMNDLSDPEVFTRAEAVKASGMRSVFALPIRNSVKQVVAVATFFSSDIRDYDSSTVSLATDLAASVVRAYELHSPHDGSASLDHGLFKQG